MAGEAAPKPQSTRRARKVSTQAIIPTERPASFDWRNPNYAAVFRERMTALRWVREHPDWLPVLKASYRANPADFINDWGVTFDPRNAELGLPAIIPFTLFPKQREWVDWVVRLWRAQRSGATEKSRDCGISWLAMGLSCTLGLHNDGVAIGCGSRKEDLVDKVGTFKPLLPKARMFMQHLPEEFAGGWLAWRDAPFMRITFPETGSIITGEAGDQIGRGDRASIFFVDEAEYLERADLVEHSLSQTTNCRMDVSSVQGSNNAVARKILGGKVQVFTFDWRDDPRKDQVWYDALSLGSDEFIERPDGTKVFGRGLDPVTIAQEVDRDRSASVEGIVIPAAWVKAALDAREKLGIAPSGARSVALDVADEGVDLNAAVGGQGIEVDHIEEWSGRGGDLFETTTRAFAICDALGLRALRYDADGLGAGVRGDARVINERRHGAGLRQIAIEGYRGSDAVFDPDGLVEGTMGANGDAGRTNKDYFANRKAQAWWALRRRFLRTYRWVVRGIPCNPDDIISISTKAPGSKALAQKLVGELSQATRRFNEIGKMLINKKPNGSKSPNLADGLVIKFAQNERPGINITPQALAQIMAAGRAPSGARTRR